MAESKSGFYLNKSGRKCAGNFDDIWKRRHLNIFNIIFCDSHEVNLDWILTPPDLMISGFWCFQILLRPDFAVTWFFIRKHGLRNRQRWNIILLLSPHLFFGILQNNWYLHHPPSSNKSGYWFSHDTESWYYLKMWWAC